MIVLSADKRGVMRCPAWVILNSHVDFLVKNPNDCPKKKPRHGGQGFCSLA
jgi:hypothetical protein